jgi:hypothetical protein
MRLHACVLTRCQFEVLTRCQFEVLTRCQFEVLTRCQFEVLTRCQFEVLTRCQFGVLTRCQFEVLTRCQFGEEMCVVATCAILVAMHTQIQKRYTHMYVYTLMCTMHAQAQTHEYARFCSYPDSNIHTYIHTYIHA